uniref:Uncharacterized protein n=1 Tax=Brassica campestris TaxID=3711 RepID=A0A3P5XZ41_BRACM|nr:unnamed protein product [Brassica rapa]
MAPSDLLGWLCLRHAMASTAPFMAGFSVFKSITVSNCSSLELPVPVCSGGVLD